MGRQEQEAPSRASCPSPDPEAPLSLLRIQKGGGTPVCTHGGVSNSRVVLEPERPSDSTLCRHEEDNDQSRVSLSGRY